MFTHRPKQQDPLKDALLYYRADQTEKLIALLQKYENIQVPFLTTLIEKEDFDFIKGLRTFIPIDWTALLGPAIKSGNQDFAVYTLENGAICGDAAFREAARLGHKDLVEYMAYFYKKYISDGLMGAILGEQIGLVEYLLKCGAARLSEALTLACQTGNPGTIKALIDAGAEDWNSGLIAAATAGNIIAARIMLKMGAKAVDLALIIAAQEGHLAMARLMIENGAKKIGYALCGAESSGHDNIAQYLRALFFAPGPRFIT